MRPQYARLQIGVIEGQESVLHSRLSGELSKVPYAEPTWLADGYYSPYFKEVRAIFTQLEEGYSSNTPVLHTIESQSFAEDGAQV